MYLQYLQCKVELSSSYHIKASVPQGSTLAPTPNNTVDIPNSNNTTLMIFADNTAILATRTDVNLATVSLQNNLNILIY